MPWDEAKTEAELKALEERMPALLAQYPHDAQFWPVFQALAGEIEAGAGDYQRAKVRHRLSCILGAQGVIPSDNVGETCR